MSSEWQITTIGEVADVVTKGTTPTTAGFRFHESGINFLKVETLSEDGRFILDKIMYISTEAHEALARSKLQKDDVLFTIAGTIGRTALVNEEILPANTNQAIAIVRPKKSIVLPRFLRYVMSNPCLTQNATSRTVQSVQANFSLGELKATKFSLPSLSTQKKISDFLGHIDDRITLLIETNATLEGIAQALFKSWFVDFDPVRAKMEGRAPEGMDESTAALFPDSFEESELGAVPRGWLVSTLGECCSYLSRGISPKYIDEGGLLVINQKCIRDFSVDLSKARRHDPAQRKAEGREIFLGDVLVNSTGVGTLGRVAQVLDLPEPAISDSHVTVLRASPKISCAYLGQLLMRMQPDIEEMGEGTTGQTELSRSKLAGLKMLVPNESLLQAFDNLVVPLKKRIAENSKQVQTLANLRDSLLPRLISGQLRLS